MLVYLLLPQNVAILNAYYVK